MILKYTIVIIASCVVLSAHH